MSLIPLTQYSCYDYIIGLFKGTCECYDPKTGYELDYNTSYSGLYLNKLAPLQNLTGLENCENEALWTMMAEARGQATINFVNDINRAVSAKYKLLYRPYSGIIGRISNSKDLAITENYAGIILRCNPVRGAKMTLQAIGTIFNYTGTIDVTIYNNLNESLGTYTLVTTTDTYVENSLADLELPMYSDYVDVLEYYFLYSLTGTQQPRDNDLCCFCGPFKPFYNLDFPYYTKLKEPAYGWANYVMAGGMGTDDTDFMEDETFIGGNLMNGLILKASFNCNFGETYCKDTLDFVGDPVAGAIAHAIWYRSAFLLADSILMSGEINRQKMLNNEGLIEFQKEWVEKYQEMITYIADNIDASRSGCFGCRDKVQIHKMGILA